MVVGLVEIEVVVLVVDDRLAAVAGTAAPARDLQADACGLDCGGPSGSLLTGLPCGSRKSADARIASEGALIVTRLVLTKSLPWLRFLASSISSWQRGAVMMGWTNTFGRSTSLPISSSTLVALC